MPPTWNCPIHCVTVASIVAYARACAVLDCSTPATRASFAFGAVTMFVLRGEACAAWATAREVWLVATHCSASTHCCVASLPSWP